jgi:CxxC motif-containing protein
MSELSTIKIIRCIICPTGCEIKVKKGVGEQVTFEGYTCERGLEYAQQEFYEPKRILTSTMRIENGLLPLIPVRTDKAILKEKLKDVLVEIAKKKLQAPIKMGDILIENILGLGANIIASRDLVKLG